MVPTPRITVWPADAGGTGWYRLRFPARALAEAGAGVVVDDTGPSVAWSERWSGAQPPPWVYAVALARRPEADVIVMQRPARKWWAQVIPMLQALGIRVVVDVDDRVDRIDPANAAYEHYNQPAGSWHSWRHIESACRAADLVTATTPDLIRRFGFGHGVVLPNLVPSWYLAVRPQAPPGATLGWSGSVETHPGDLEVTGGAVGRALAGTDWHVHVVGTGKGVAERLGVEAVSTTRGWVEIEDYPARLAEIGVGIVPLADTEFNRSKSALKMSEMAAVGVPVVASPTPDNRRLHALGVGQLAATPNQWRRHLRRLVTSSDARADLAGRGRDVMRHQTYEAHAGRWLDAWTTPLKSLTRPKETAHV